MSTLRVNTIQNTSDAHSSTPEEIAQGRAKAWVNFDGTFGSSPFTLGNNGIRNSFNVSSVTDNGTGNYTVTFATAMPNANYVVCMSGATDNNYTRAGTGGSSSLTASTAQVFIANSNGSSADREYCAISIFGD